jgi:serine/threonine protein kinase
VAHTNCSLLLLSYGAYREVFLINITEEFVWKEIRHDADMEYDNFEFVRMDAMVSERLSSNFRIVDIYGYCGMSLFTEFFVGHDLEDILMPDGGSIEKGQLNDTNDVDPQNDLSPGVKLVLALEIAEAIAVLHSYEGGPIVHDDIQPSQFLHTKDGVLKLNDFNRAELLLWDEEHQEYCRYRNGPGQGTVSEPLLVFPWDSTFLITHVC